jgi:hypothetical protein
VHGHAHKGTEKGETPGGVRVRNVAMPVIQQAYAVYGINGFIDTARKDTARKDTARKDTARKDAAASGAAASVGPH